MPAAIHLSPEGVAGGDIGKIQNGDILRLDAQTGELTWMVDAQTAAQRVNVCQLEKAPGMGRELFSVQRATALPAELGGGILGDLTNV